MNQRRFLFLQGPHGPFFRHLARALDEAGCASLKIGFNGGDRAFWWPRRGYIPFRGSPDSWAEAFSRIIAERGVTDLVVYGDTRPPHAQALTIAQAEGITTHIFEEGYLRAYWVTYERDGANGRSPLMKMPQSVFDAPGILTDTGEKPATGWGDMKEHIFYGAAYHAGLLAGRHAYPSYRGHRGISVAREAWLSAVKFLALPYHSVTRRIATARIRWGGYPYHLVLLQLEHDASFRDHSPYGSMTEFVDEVVTGFARGAPRHHHLLFKAHPLEDGRAPLRATIRDAARAQGIARRVHYLRGGKLAGLLDDTLSAVTVNSTAGQQVLRRGLPLKAMGRAVYCRDGFTSGQALVRFFADPAPPDLAAYRAYRRYLLSTCQVPGGFYSALGRRKLVRRIVDMMLSSHGPYRTQSFGEAAAQHLSVVG